MQAREHQHKYIDIDPGTYETSTEQLSCLETRRELDSLFAGFRPSDASGTARRQSLFRHLADCEKCCRSFDARMRTRITALGGFVM